MNKTWKPTTAGILNIIAGALSLFLLLMVIIGVVVFMAAEGAATSIEGVPVQVVPGIILSLAIPITLLDVLAIIGGAYAFRRKMWGLSLAGSIAAVFTSWPMGVAAIVFIVMSKNEFD